MCNTIQLTGISMFMIIMILIVDYRLSGQVAPPPAGALPTGSAPGQYASNPIKWTSGRRGGTQSGKLRETDQGLSLEEFSLEGFSLEQQSREVSHGTRF
jgi:hypothetical protein